MLVWAEHIFCCAATTMEVVPARSESLLLKKQLDAEGRLMEIEISCGGACAGMYNATKMCNGLGRLVANYSKSDKANEYLSCLERRLQKPVSDLLYYDKTSKVTWAHELVAIDLAGWLSAEFKVCMAEVMLDYMKKQVTKAQSEAAQATMQAQRRFQREAVPAIEAEDSLTQFVRRGYGGFTFSPELRSLKFKDFWELYKRWCNANEMRVVKLTATEAPEYRLMLTADEVDTRGSVVVKGERIIGMDHTSMVNTPWRKYGQDTLQAFLISSGVVVPHPNGVVTVETLRRLYHEFCEDKPIPTQAWKEKAVHRALLEFEKYHQKNQISPKHHTGTIVDGQSSYTGIELTARLWHDNMADDFEM